jgi:DNA-binding FadR family transcriptional regulator
MPAALPRAADMVVRRDGNVSTSTMSETTLGTKQIAGTAGSPSLLTGAPIERPDLVALVTDSIRQRILDGTHPPGSTLPAQGKLAATFNVSVNVIREAMRNLRSLGMVEVSQGRCPQVKGGNPEASINAFSIMLAHSNGSLYHLMESRVPLEIQVATLAAERATPEDVARIGQTIADMKATDDPERIVRCDQAFHRSLAKATGNPILLVMVDTLSGLQCQLMRDAHVFLGITERTIGEHNRILEAVQRHDEKAAGQAMLLHLEAVLQRIPNGQDPSAPLTENAVEESLAALGKYPLLQGDGA